MPIPNTILEALDQLPDKPTHEDLCKIWIPLIDFYFPFQTNESLPNPPPVSLTPYNLDVKYEPEKKYTSLAVGRFLFCNTIYFFHLLCVSALEKEMMIEDPWATLENTLLHQMTRQRYDGSVEEPNIPISGAISFGRVVRLYKLSPEGELSRIRWGSWRDNFNLDFAEKQDYITGRLLDIHLDVELNIL